MINLTQMSRTAMSFLKTLGVAAALLLCVFTESASAQPGQNPSGQNPQTNYADSLRLLRMESEALAKILSALESIDTARQNELIQWIITDRNIRSRVISALRKQGRNISPNSVAELTVTQKPPTSFDEERQLLRLVIESVGVYGEANIKRLLGENLYATITSRNYEHTLVSTAPVQERVQFVAVDASLFGGSILFKSGFGFALTVGNDYLGYPFWLPGTLGTYGLLRRGTTDFMLGLEWPLKEAGVSEFAISGGFSVKNRKLMGTQAFGARIEQDLGLLEEQSGKLHFGAELFNAFTPNLSTFPLLARQERYATEDRFGGNRNISIDSLYYIGLSTHGYVSYRLPESILRGAYVQVGGGTHRINAVTVGSPVRDSIGAFNSREELHQAKQYSYFDPFVKIGYVRSGDAGDEYGVSLQYCNTLLAEGFIKLFPWLQLEAKYSAVIGRDARKWEWKDYVMVSPRLTLNF
jgi:hypothetical protein